MQGQHNLSTCAVSAERRQKRCEPFGLAGEFSWLSLSERLLLSLCSAAAWRKLKIIVESESHRKHPVHVFALHQDSHVEVIILSAPAETKEKCQPLWFGWKTLNRCGCLKPRCSGTVSPPISGSPFLIVKQALNSPDRPQRAQCWDLWLVNA